MNSEKKKPQTASLEPQTSLEDLLKKAGFQTLETPSPHVIHASGAEDFGKAHAAFLQAAGKNVAIIDSRKFCTVPKPILIVHRRPVETVHDVETPATGNEQPATDQEQSD